MGNNEHNPALKNTLLRNTAFVCLSVTLAMVVDGYFSGRVVPSELYALTTTVVGAWMGFSKWGEVRHNDR